MVSTLADIGIIIKQTKFGEADKFIRILALDHGLIEVIAKGARRVLSRKSAHLDSLNLIKFQASQRPTGIYLNQAEVINSFPLIKSDIKLVRTCFYLLEIINQVIPLDQTDPLIFKSFNNYLTSLNQPNVDSLELTVKFQLYLIKHLGFPMPKDISPQSLINYFESLINRSLVSKNIRL